MYSQELCRLKCIALLTVYQTGNHRYTVKRRLPGQSILWALVCHLGKKQWFRIAASAPFSTIVLDPDDWTGVILALWCELQFANYTKAENWSCYRHHSQWHCSFQVDIFKIDEALPFPRSPMATFFAIFDNKPNSYLLFQSEFDQMQCSTVISLI